MRMKQRNDVSLYLPQNNLRALTLWTIIVMKQNLFHTPTQLQLFRNTTIHFRIKQKKLMLRLVVLKYFKLNYLFINNINLLNHSDH